MSTTQLAWHTFEQKRTCLHCGKPIADQEHGSMKFCRKTKLPDGSIQSCKDDYHAPRRKRENAPFLRIALFQKAMHAKIVALFKAKGKDVSIEDINRYGINLYRSVEFALDKNGKFTFYYHEFAVQQLPDGKYKIFRHDKLL